MIISLDSFIKKNNKNKVDIINIGSIYGSRVPDFNMYKKGDRFNQANIKTFRPNIGLSASKYFDVLGKKVPYDIEKFKPLKKNILEIKKNK